MRTRIFILISVAFLASAPVSTVAGQDGSSPASGSAQDASIHVIVVYDANNNGVYDEADYSLDENRFTVEPITPAAGPAQAVVDGRTGKGGEPGDLALPARSYRIVAIGPQYLRQDAGEVGAVCRGWRTSFISGIELSKTAPQPTDSFGFVVDLDPASDSDIVIGVSDKGAPGTPYEGVQIFCPDAGGAAALPETGAPSGQSDRALMFGLTVGFGALAVIAGGFRCFAGTHVEPAFEQTAVHIEDDQRLTALRRHEPPHPPDGPQPQPRRDAL